MLTGIAGAAMIVPVWLMLPDTLSEVTVTALD
jgi:hypothetical protein